MPTKCAQYWVPHSSWPISSSFFCRAVAWMFDRVVCHSELIWERPFQVSEYKLHLTWGSKYDSGYLFPF